MPHVIHNAEDTCLINQPTQQAQGEARPRPGDAVAASPTPAPHNDVEKCVASANNVDHADTPPSAEAGMGHPDGGLKAWLVVFGSFCAMGAIYGLINTSAVFESYFRTHQLSDYSHSEIGWIFSLYLFLVFFVGVQVGPLFDRFGPRWLVAAGTSCITASLMLLSVSKTYYQIMLTYSVLGGLGGALLNAPAYSAITHWFDKKRGFATGIATTAGGIGGIVFPLILQPLLAENGVGFPWACRILGFIMLGLSIPANLFIRSRDAIQNAESGKPKSIWPDFTIFRELQYTITCAGFFFMEWGLFVPITYIISYALAFGIGSQDASMMLSLLNAGSVLGRFLPGLLADKVGRFNVIIVTIGLCIVTVLGIWLPCQGNFGVLIAFCILFGFASGSNLGLIPVCFSQFCHPQQFGRYFATANMVASFGTLSSVPIGGALLSLGQNKLGWTAVILFSGLSYAIALCCYLAARVLSAGWNPRTKF